MSEQKKLCILVVGEDCMTDGRELMAEIEQSCHTGEYLCVKEFNKKCLTYNFSRFDTVILLGQDEDVDALTALRLFEMAQLHQLPILVVSEEKEDGNIKLVDAKTTGEVVKFEQSLVGTFFELIFFPSYKWTDWADRVVSCAEEIYDVSIGAPAVFLSNVEDVPEGVSV